MSRTPLFRLVQRSLRLARHSLHSPQSVAEIADRARRPASLPGDRAVSDGVGGASLASLSRRRFVTLSAGAAAAIAVEGCLPPAVARSTGSRRPVVIVGAGIAGLTAGLRLRQAGMPVRIYDAQDRVGGRMYSLRDGMADGQVIELGGELIDSNHTRIRALAGELGIPLDDLALDDPALSREIWYFGGVRRSDAEVIEAFRPLAARIERARAAFPDDEITYRAPGGTTAVDRQTLADWLDDADVRGWLRTLIDVAYTTEYGLEPGDQSALNLLTMIGTGPDSFDVFGESDERFHVRGGNDRITTAVAEMLDDAIHTGHVLEAVGRRADGVYLCTFRRDAGTVEVEADQVILALPFTLLRTVSLDVDLPEPKRRAIAELGYGTNAKLMVGFGERVWRTRHGANGSSLTDLPYQLTWETSRLQGGASGVLTNFTGGRHGIELGAGTAGDQAARLLGDLERVFPGAAAAHAGQRAVRFHWPTFPWTLGSYASYHPGQWTALRGAEGESVDRLHFAGEHCSLPAQGFMEGGCETGEAAARAVLAAAGMRSASRRTALRALAGVA
jgi:monoamine oxidase